jgi:O-antigen ligase
MYPLLLGLIFYFDFSKNKMFLFSLITFATLFLVLISGERTAFFLMIISFTLMFFLIYKNKKFIRNIFLIFVASCIFILSFSESIKNRIIDVTLEQMISSKAEEKRIYILSRQHDEHYTSAIRMFKKNPLFGVGVKNFRVFCNNEEFFISNYTCSPHPHNTYIQLLSETGLIGFLIIFSIFIYLNFRLLLHFLSCFKKKYLYDDLQICLLIGLYLTLWPLVPSGNFFNNWLSIVHFYPVGILLWSFKHNTKINDYS